MDTTPRTDVTDPSTRVRLDGATGVNSDVARFLTELRHEYRQEVPNDVAASHLRGILAASAQIPAPTPASRWRDRTRRIAAIGTLKIVLTATAAAAATGSGLAATGNLPASTQRAVAEIADRVGLTLPEPARPEIAPAVEPSDTPASERHVPDEAPTRPDDAGRAPESSATERSGRGTDADDDGGPPPAGDDRPGRSGRAADADDEVGDDDAGEDTDRGRTGREASEHPGRGAADDDADRSADGSEPARRSHPRDAEDDRDTDASEADDEPDEDDEAAADASGTQHRPDPDADDHRGTADGRNGLRDGLRDALRPRGS